MVDHKLVLGVCIGLSLCVGYLAGTGQNDEKARVVSRDLRR